MVAAVEELAVAVVLHTRIHLAEEPARQSGHIDSAPEQEQRIVAGVVVEVVAVVTAVDIHIAAEYTNFDRRIEVEQGAGRRLAAAAAAAADKAAMMVVEAAKVTYRMGSTVAVVVVVETAVVVPDMMAADSAHTAAEGVDRIQVVGSADCLDSIRACFPEPEVAHIEIRMAAVVERVVEHH